MDLLPKSPPTASSGGKRNTTYVDSLFGENDCELDGICFDLGEQHNHDGLRSNNLSWCMSGSSNSSCCSLCRLPAVSEAGEEESKLDLELLPIDDDARIDQDQASKPKLKEVTVHHTSDQVPTSGTSCVCCTGGGFEDAFKLPQSISIPSCLDPLSSSSSSVLQAKKAVTKLDDVSVSSSTNHPDYLSSGFLPDDALCHIVKFLDVPSLVQLRECNTKLCSVATKNTAGWTDHCNSLWKQKANVCSAARELLALSTSKACTDDDESSSSLAMKAYKLSVTDATQRQEVSLDEICFDNNATSSSHQDGIIWSFRFKESAGRDWTSWDPWWNHRDARKLVFLKDGSIKQVYPQGVTPSVVTHNGTSLYDVFSERTVQRDGVDVPAPRIEMKWRMVKRPLDMPARAEGAYVRITVGGRDVPTYVVRRSPTGNWGFILESCWGVYASFELAPKAKPEQRSRRRLRRTRNGSMWVNEESDDEDNEIERERMRNVRRRIDTFMEESAMTIHQNGYSQWREALLYNIGAVTLPEGGDGDAGDEFDAAWQNAMLMR